MKINNLNFTSLFKPKKTIKDYNIHYKNGIAYNENGEFFNGKVKHKDSKGNKYKITYENGKPNKVKKNHKLYKQYFYGTQNWENIGSYYFSDNTSIPYQQYYHIKNEAITQIYDRQSSKLYFTYNNKNNGIKNDPKRCISSIIDLDRQTETHNVIKLDKKPIVVFESIEKAEKYFLDEYGIKAEFKNLSQAYVINQAINEFIPLNYQNKGKKLFEGLKITNEADVFENNTKDFAQVHTPLKWNIPEDENIDSIEEYLNLLDEDPNIVTSETPILQLNPCAEYSASEIDYEHKINYHPTKFFSGYYAHELTHWLHAKNSLKDAIKANLSIPDYKDRQTMKIVGTYASLKYSEFIAEYASGRMEGKTYPKEVNQLYLKLNGPMLFDDLYDYNSK